MILPGGKRKKSYDQRNPEISLMSNAIEIRGLVKKYAQFQLSPLNLNVPQGAIYGLVGPNGAGKTTAIDLIFGMGLNDSGQIRVLGLDHRAFLWRQNQAEPAAGSCPAPGSSGSRRANNRP